MPNWIVHGQGFYKDELEYHNLRITVQENLPKQTPIRRWYPNYYIWGFFCLSNMGRAWHWRFTLVLRTGHETNLRKGFAELPTSSIEFPVDSCTLHGEDSRVHITRQMCAREAATAWWISPGMLLRYRPKSQLWYIIVNVSHAFKPRPALCLRRPFSCKFFMFFWGGATGAGLKKEVGLRHVNGDYQRFVYAHPRKCVTRYGQEDGERTDERQSKRFISSEDKDILSSSLSVQNLHAKRSAVLLADWKSQRAEQLANK